MCIVTRRKSNRKGVKVVKGWMVKEFKQTREYDGVSTLVSHLPW